MATDASSAAAAPFASWFLGRVLLTVRGPSERTPLRTDAGTVVRIGILGAARIAPTAVIVPARLLPNVEIRAVAARDKARATEFARKHGIPVVYGSYDELFASPDIDAVYIPSPNGLHKEHALAALRAGKHVLCEKPLASNAADARLMADAAVAQNKILFEAFHYRYHPANVRLREIVQSGEIGDVTEVDVGMRIFSGSFSRDDIRFNYPLAGGAMMDAGCYTVNVLRSLIGTEPTSVRSATCQTTPSNPHIDLATDAVLEFPSPDGTRTIVGSFCASLNSSLMTFVSSAFTLKVTGTKGTVSMSNWIMPAIYHSITVAPAGGPQRVERHYDNGASTYYFQLRAFADAVQKGASFPTSAEDGVRNMAVLDAVYTKAGLPVRGTPV